MVMKLEVLSLTFQKLVATQGGFSDFLHFVRTLKVSQDIHDKVVIFAASRDKVRIF